MSDDTRAPKSRKAARPKAAEAAAANDERTAVDAPTAMDAPTDVEEATPTTPVVAPAAAASDTAAPDTAAPDTAASDTAASATATGEVAPATEAARTASDQQVVYVQTPVPPRARGNRVVGVLLAVLGAIIFAVVYAVISALIIDLRSGDLFGPDFGAFLGNAFFWVPGLVFLVGLVLLVLVLNRAGWWAHVLGSLLLAIAVYFGMIGVLLLVGNVFHGSPDPVSFASLTVNPWVIAAALVAREVSIWMGLAIAARGRRVKVRNVETRTAWDREQQEKKAEYERTGAPAA